MHISEVRNPQLPKADRPKEGADENGRGVAAMLDRFPWLTCGRKSAPLAEDRFLFQDGFQTSTPLGSDRSMQGYYDAKLGTINFRSGLTPPSLLPGFEKLLPGAEELPAEPPQAAVSAFGGPFESLSTLARPGAFGPLDDAERLSGMSMAPSNAPQWLVAWLDSRPRLTQPEVERILKITEARPGRLPESQSLATMADCDMVHSKMLLVDGQDWAVSDHL